MNIHLHHDMERRYFTLLHVKIENTSYEYYGELETYFGQFRKHVIGIDQHFISRHGSKKIIYADWTASGRLYRPIEEKIINQFGPFVANTHTETNVTATIMTDAYNQARKMIKNHVGADEDDVLISAGSGMTAAINKLQRLLGLKIPEKFKKRMKIAEEDRPVIFVTHMEHHSNQLSWIETIGEVVCLEPASDGTIDIGRLEQLLLLYKNRKMKIGSFTACSNVTGIQTPYHQLAKIMHEHGGICFIDFSASAPYVDINLHPKSPLEKLDGIFFSPHKFLGGPGSSGILVMDSKLCLSNIPDHPGGGTVLWTNPWGGHRYLPDVEMREDGGTPGFLQTIKTALCIKLKETMGIDNILQREKEILNILLPPLSAIPGLHILDELIEDRIGIVSFYIEKIHYNLLARVLNDRFGIQVRGGCSCAGTYGHYLFDMNKEKSKEWTDLIDQGDLSSKPGWVRLSIHPIMTNAEIYYIIKSIKDTIKHIDEWQKDYIYERKTNDFHHKDYQKNDNIQDWFEMNH